MKITFFALVLCFIFKTSGADAGTSDQLNVLVSELAPQMNNHADTVDFIFRWVTENVTYDVALAKVDYSDESAEEIIDYVIDTRSGVCQHYTELFAALCRAFGYESYVIPGYTRTGNAEIDSVPHAWNALKINGKWFMFDPTWAAGYVENDVFYFEYSNKWYKVAPEKFVKTHIPFDPLWLTAGISEEHAEHSALLTGETLTETEKIKASIDRIKNCDERNPLTNKYLENLVDHYNFLLHEEAVRFMHEAIDNFNDYKAAVHGEVRRPSSYYRDLDGLLDAAYASARRSKALLHSINFEEGRNKTILRKNLKTTEKLVNEIYLESRF